MKIDWGTFLKAFLSDLLVFGIVVLDGRAVIAGSYLGVAFTQLLFGLQTFYVAKWMTERSEARSRTALVGFLLGGLLGSELALWAGIHLFGAAR